MKQKTQLSLDMAPPFRIDTSSSRQKTRQLTISNNFASPISHNRTPRNDKWSFQYTSAMLNSPSNFKYEGDIQNMFSQRSNSPKRLSKIFTQPSTTKNTQFQQDNMSTEEIRTYQLFQQSSRPQNNKINVNSQPNITFHQFKVKISHPSFTSKKNGGIIDKNGAYLTPKQNTAQDKQPIQHKIDQQYILNAVRQQRIVTQTNRKGLGEQLSIIKEFKDNIINSKQTLPTEQDHKNTIRKTFYRNIYDNVKKISGQQKDIEEQNIRNQNIVDFINNNDNYLQFTKKPKKVKPKSINLIKIINKSQKSIDQVELGSKRFISNEIDSISPDKISTIIYNSPVIQNSPVSLTRKARNIIEGKPSREISPNIYDRIRNKSSFTSSSSEDQIIEDEKMKKSSKVALIQNFSPAFENVFGKVAGTKASHFYRKNNLVTIDTKKILRQSSNINAQSGHSDESPYMRDSQRNNIISHKQIDFKLLHILITRWKSVIKSPNKNTYKRNSITIKVLTSEIKKRQARYHHIATVLLRWMQKMNRCKVSLKYLQKEDFSVFSITPFQSDGSYMLFKLVKYNNMEKVNQLLKQNNKLIWEFNHLGQNCLHVAAKHNLTEMIRLLHDNGADYDQKDFMDRTPLFYAVQNNHKQSFIQLISMRAEPWGIHSNFKYFAELLKNLKRVHLMLLFTPIPLKQYVFEHEFKRLTS